MNIICKKITYLNTKVFKILKINLSNDLYCKKFKDLYVY